MKKILFSLMAFLASSGIALGQNALTVGDFTLPQNGGTMRVTLTLDEENVYTGYQLKIETPDGLGYVTDIENDVECTLGTGHSNSHGATAHWNEATRLLTIGVSSNKSALFSGQTVVLDIPMSATSAGIGTTHNFNITGIDFIKQENATKVGLSDVPFTVTIGAPVEQRTILDETSTTAPEAATGVDVRVKRTIKANEWSTLCLPFAMTAAQVTAAFGDAVELGDFTGCDVDDTTGDIQVKFSNVTAIEANHPYIIKVSKPVTVFTVDGVDIVPEDEPSINKDKSGRRYNSFIGTYVAETVVPDYALFLSDNQFWFSTGKTKMKAFRAYFDLDAAGAEYEDAEVAARITMAFDEDVVTGIGSLTPALSKGEEVYYNLKGQQVVAPSKGLYIKDGKKMVVK